MVLPKFAWFQGRVVPYGEARVGVLTHGLNYGTGCFAGIRAFWNADEEELFIFRAHDHFRRFLESARLLAMDLAVSAEDLVEHLVALLRAEGYREDCYIRPLAFLSDETIGVRLHGLTPALSIVAFPFGKYLDCDEGAHLTISSWRRIDDGVIPPRGKLSGGYVNSALAKTDAQKAGFDDAILLDARGKVSEASVSNVFVVRRGELVTPQITDGVLEGITRRTVIELARRELSLPVVERSIDRTELLVADEIFLAGTGIGIVPVTRIDHRPVRTGEIGEVASSVRRLYGDATRGKLAAYRSWCHPVFGNAVRRPVRVA